MEVIDKRSMAIDMRKSGMTMQRIGEELGVSKQRVYQYLATTDGMVQSRRYFPIKPSVCIYEGLREWLNSNCCGMAQFLDLLGYEYNPTQAKRYRDKLMSESGNCLRISDIKRILSATGLTFEECFGTITEG